MTTLPKPADFWDKTYRAPSLPSKMVMVLLVLFALLLFGWGYDYTRGENGTSPSTLVLQALIGIEFWGYALMLAGIWQIIGLVLRNHLLVWTSHVFSCALNVALVIMIAQAAFYADEGFAELVLPVSGVCWHSVFVYLSRPNFSITAEEAA